MRPGADQPSQGDRLLPWLRPVLSVIAALSVFLIAYGAVYNLGRPRNPHPDPLLAARLIPLELLLGVLAGVLAYRAFGRRQLAAPRSDTQERMVARLALRRGGRFTLLELTESSPLTEPQAREVLGRMLETGRLNRDGDGYRLL
ncbi:hypothetical protein Q0M94_16125 [Deinococcus radiomollis]|uniref:hypothetical protein n=1 Tax=Deinococcus radiomollis TaxID=468916 RepID=UPI003892A3DF